ncbi:MAG TPA: amidohydrolase family protein [Bryobacteraceae bacterium]|nr:amidohydrolase family protein [Bryobacteraceae bacterium]
MTRRQFASLAATAAFGQRMIPELKDASNFCSHEHWGSIDSIGTFPGGYRADIEQGAHPKQPTSVFDIVLEPYFRGVLASSKVEWESLNRERVWSKLKESIGDHTFNGIFQCTRRGIQFLYGLDIAATGDNSTSRLNEMIDRSYKTPFGWYRTAMAKAHFSDLVRPVHPEFYRRQESRESAKDEASFTKTVMRIDPILDLWHLPAERRKSLLEFSGVEPIDAKSWQAFLTYWFEQAQRSRAVGIKQLQAYRRDLDFQARNDNDIDDWKGTASTESRRKLQDWIVNECCKNANDLGWAHQVHVGTHNLPSSTPLPLAGLARRYPRMRVVMIHCWPFLEEAGTLARQNSNIYIDTCWQPILNPQFFRTAISQWWNYVPSNKIICGHDATTVEMAVGSSLFTREILSDVVQEQRRTLNIAESELIRAAKNMLHANAALIYGNGSKTPA